MKFCSHFTLTILSYSNSKVSTCEQETISELKVSPIKSMRNGFPFLPFWLKTKTFFCCWSAVVVKDDFVVLAGMVVVTVGVVVDITSLHSKSEHGQPPLQFFYSEKYINDIQDLYR